MNPIYLDYNATTPLHPAAADAMRPFLTGIFGNPSSSHRYGREARAEVEKARARVARLLGSSPDEIIFTSGGTESNNMALKGSVLSRRTSGNHIITSAIEHPAILEVCRYLEDEGYAVTCLDVDERGMVDPGDLEKALTPETILITVMLANNEIGTIEPVAELARIASENNILIHTDAAQAVGKMPVNVGELGVDMLSLAGHKLYGPKGVGALYLRRGTGISKFIHGAGQESGLRAGTENVMEIAGLGAACEAAGEDPEGEAARMRELRDRLYHRLKESDRRIRLNGHPEKRLPNTLSVSFPGIDASALLSSLEGVAASAGAACHSGADRISATLSAISIPGEYAAGTVRLSTGRFTTVDEIDRAAGLISEAVRGMKR